MFKKLLFLLLSVLFLCSCGGRNNEVEVASGGVLMMDTFVSITIFNPRPGDEGLINETFEYMRGLERILSRTYEGGDVWRVNNAPAGVPVPVSRELIEILEFARDWRGLTHDLFDVTIGAVSELWDFTVGAMPPDSDSVKSALMYVGMDYIIPGIDTVKKAHDGVKLDLGGIAKGFIADAAHDFLREQGAEAAVIDAGGDIRLLGTRPVTGTWTVGIEHIYGQGLTLSGGAVATSGSAQRGFYYDGIFYHHILDPSTGFPRLTDLAAVTVTAANTVTAEIISTTAFMLGLNCGVDFIERLNADSFKVGAVFVDIEGNVVMVGNFFFTHHQSHIPDY